MTSHHKRRKYLLTGHFRPNLLLLMLQNLPILLFPCLIKDLRALYLLHDNILKTALENKLFNVRGLTHTSMNNPIVM